MRRYLMLLALVCFCAPALAEHSPLEQENRRKVLAFYQLALNDKDFAAARPYLGDHYIQHNPGVKDGIEGFREFIEFLREHYPTSRSEVRQVFVDGDHVIVQVKNTGREPGVVRSIIDIYRLEQGRIVEHWDATQVLPDKTLNSNGVFPGD
ncbi:nuclear transport factor 2 family protein [Pseudomonas sp. MPFS]|uniref:nuclear transport factor 2 family protein n=1 Tax=Pseudomonas sp. MPFS TaxID=2795724 RepID=UPI001F1336A6|nr:nuclear transport factor 2 family protein [Pseudomonas sp. MPFS]UMZ09258.1 nuclear transport factor 2 family protein [Pseudomonas sp. MPFS]